MFYDVDDAKRTFVGNCSDWLIFFFFFLRNEVAAVKSTWCENLKARLSKVMHPEMCLCNCVFIVLRCRAHYITICACVCGSSVALFVVSCFFCFSSLFCLAVTAGSDNNIAAAHQRRSSETLPQNFWQWKVMGLWWAHVSVCVRMFLRQQRSGRRQRPE